MVQPIDYTVPMQNPLAAFEQAANFGMGIQQNQQALEANRLKIEAEKAGQERLRQVGELVMKAASPDATIDDMRAVMMTAASPEQLKAYESKLSAMTTEQKKAEFTPALQVKYALNSGKPDLAKKILMDRATALENSGDAAGAQRARAMAETIDDDGGVTVSADIASKLAFDSEIGTPALEAMRKELLAPAEIAKGKAEADRAGSLAKSAVSQAIIDEVGAENAPAMAKLERQSKAVGIQLDQARIREIGNSIKVANENLKMAREAATGLGVKLPVATQALVNKVATDSVVNQQAGLNYIDFANRVAGSNVRGGFMGTADKFIQGMGGDPNLIRLEATKLINSDAMAGLPAGSASDKDVAMVREGYPDNVNSKTLTQFFRGTAKVKLIQAQTQSNTAEWLTMNGTLGPARAPMTVGGRPVKPGETFTKFNGSAAAEIIRNVDRQVAQTAVKPPVKPQGRAASGGKIPGVTVSNF